LRAWDIAAKLGESGVPAKWLPEMKLVDGDALTVVHEACTELYSQTILALRNGEFPVTIGGDHSMAIGSWSAVVDYHDAQQDLGLLWVDAHLDAHTMETSDSGAIHGMPAACLLGNGDDSLVNIGSQGAKLNPAHLVYVGVRSFETAERAYLEGLGVTIYDMAEVERLGTLEVMNRAFEQVQMAPAGFGITIDLDAFDPDRAPGVGSPEADGLLRAEMFTALQSIGHHPRLRAFEVAEYNPEEGYDDLTKQLVLDLLVTVFAP
jgi:arginase